MASPPAGEQVLLEADNEALRRRLAEDERKLGQLGAMVTAIERDFAGVERRKGGSRGGGGGGAARQRQRQHAQELELEQALLIRQNKHLRQGIAAGGGGGGGGRQRAHVGARFHYRPGGPAALAQDASSPQRAPDPLGGGMAWAQGPPGPSGEVELAGLDEPGVVLLIEKLLRRDDRVRQLQRQLGPLRAQAGAAKANAKAKADAPNQAAAAANTGPEAAAERELAELDGRLATKTHAVAELESKLAGLKGRCEALLQRVEAQRHGGGAEAGGAKAKAAAGAAQLTLAAMADRLKTEGRSLVAGLEAARRQNKRLASAGASAESAAESAARTQMRLGHRLELLEAQQGCSKLLLAGLVEQEATLSRTVATVGEQTDGIRLATRKLQVSRATHNIFQLLASLRLSVARVSLCFERRRWC